MKLLVLFFLAASSLVLADDFCGVVVNVQYASGLSADVPVFLLDKEGATVDFTISKAGQARFCDFGFGLHSIRVGPEICGTVTLGDVRLRFGVTQQFRVIVPDCPSGVDGLVYPVSCFVYLRIADQGKQLGDAEVTVDGGKTVRSDQYGRVGLRVLSGRESSLSVKAPGHLTSNIRVSCTRMESIERSVQLRRE